MTDPTPIDRKRIDALEKERVAHANNTAAICTRIGAIPDEKTLAVIGVEALADRLFGVIELDEAGHYVSGPIERLEFEVERAELTLIHMQNVEAEWAERRKRATGLTLPPGVNGP